MFCYCTFSVWLRYTSLEGARTIFSWMSGLRNINQIWGTVCHVDCGGWWHTQTFNRLKNPTLPLPSNKNTEPYLCRFSVHKIQRAGTVLRSSALCSSVHLKDICLMVLFSCGLSWSCFHRVNFNTELKFLSAACIKHVSGIDLRSKMRTEASGLLKNMRSLQPQTDSSNRK